MTDTGQVPGEGLPENAGMVEQPGASAHGAYTYLSESTAEDEDLLLLPGAQSAWGNEVAPPAPEPVVEAVHEPGPHETSGRDSGSVDLSAVRLPGPSTPQSAPRRPLHLGPPIPDASASPVRSLADRGPAGAPVRQPGPAASGPEYLDVPPVREMPQGAAPWGAVQATAQAPAQAQVAPGVRTAETVAPAVAVTEPQQAEPVGVAQAVVARVATEAIEAVAATASEGSDADADGAQAAPAAETYGVVDPGQVFGAAMMAEAEQVPVGAVVEAGQDAADVPVSGDDRTPDAPVAPADEPAVPSVAEQPVDAAQAVPEAPEAVEAPAVAPETAQTAEPVAAEAVEPVAVEAVEPAVTQSAEVAETAEVAESAEAVEAAEPVVVAVTNPVEAPVADAAEVAGAMPAEAEAAQPQPQEPDANADASAGAAPAPEAPVAEPIPVPDPAADAVVAPQVVSEAPVPDPVVAPETDPAPEPTPEAVQASEPVAIVTPETAEPAAPVAEAPAAEAEAPAPGPEVSTAPEGVQFIDAPVAPAEPAAQQAAPEPTPEPQPGPEPEAEAVSEPPAEPVQTTDPVSHIPDAAAPGAAPPAEPAPGTAPPVAQPEPVLAATDAEPEPQPEPQPEQQAVTETAAPPVERLPVDATPASPVAAPQDVQPENQPPADQPTQPGQPLGQFVPVEGAQFPTQEQPAPEMTPAPEAIAEQQQAAEPVAVPPTVTGPTVMVPAPRGADHAFAPATPDTERATDIIDPDVAQSPEDLDTRAADQEESPAAAVEEARESTGPAAPAYDDAEREAVLKVMRERRDIRNGFRSDPIPHEVLLRVLEAAHTAPSVGHSQPWDFVVIRSADTRRAMHELATRQRDAYALSLPKGRAKQFKELKIEAILETPVNIVVTADPTRGGRHTLGRHTQPQMAPYSSALAVENLWLAARAEGLGVGWVSFFDEREMVRALGLPEHLEVVAYLCVGYVDEFPDEPELMQAGWAKRRPLSWVVHEETYGRRALPGEDPHDLLAETVASVRPLDAKALGEAWERQKRMTKPAGALGMLEIISAQLSGLSRQCPPPIPEPAAVAIFAGDHGVHAQGVTPWPQEVTAQMVANFLGGGAVCNAFASQVGAEVCVVDVGVAADLPATPGLLPRKVRAGTSDMTTGPAMTREEAKQAIEVGIETARDLVAAGNKALLTGEMGIANTTASAALISVFTGADPAEVTGRGTGINDETLARKTEVVRRALDFHQPDPADPIGVLAAIGGFEHAAMVGLLLGGASLRTPVILDGVSAGAAALVARAIAPEVLAACIAGHRSAEPGHVAALNKLGLRPLVDLDLRLGEGTGALLALPLVQSTARAMHEVATFDSAGVTEK
ncbi:nicotinate-nucleotide--dimethylbenzimidazole phosphoribosyltransferase [Streptomyces sp. ME18-1-4]|uniref:nicotinate-nucleotide--dimethylbenzimidazole phosphoribosyltransferase n=1 Tax=Streptomyces sp. ME18-1-4 TaxID=3028685 RepID=UPI0029B240BB|nr:nicotinate-nucleotide--dimethylbenzimidazole phosphoribosyltransferase [Streptomyces sp. ME18-1-4]MDX3241433.1 nicotinate-nucleotide--dimethylbenzimidazole phosphoribosyltransferase [Streptomyces sp. ME18-1-4]